jgi:hypothetical protein
MYLNDMQSRKPIKQIDIDVNVPDVDTSFSIKQYPSFN